MGFREGSYAEGSECAWVAVRRTSCCICRLSAPRTARCTAADGAEPSRAAGRDVGAAAATSKSAVLVRSSGRSFVFFLWRTIFLICCAARHQGMLGIAPWRSCSRCGCETPRCLVHVDGDHAAASSFVALGCRSQRCASTARCPRILRVSATVPSVCPRQACGVVDHCTVHVLWLAVCMMHADYLGMPLLLP